ncbi:MAG: hypothetical protein ABL908_05205, partial [Hyphomicrobium sp.]
VTIGAAAEKRSSWSMSVGPSFTGTTPTGGSASVSRSSASGTSYAGASVAAGGDTTVRGGINSTGVSDAHVPPEASLRADASAPSADGTLTARVGVDLTVESMQDPSRSRSLSYGISGVGGQNGLGGARFAGA